MSIPNQLDEDCEIQIVSRDSHYNSEIKNNALEVDSAYKNPLEMESESETENKNSEKVSLGGSP